MTTYNTLLGNDQSLYRWRYESCGGVPPSPLATPSMGLREKQFALLNFRVIMNYVGNSCYHRSGTAAAAAAKSLQLCLTHCDPRDGSPPGPPVPGLLQARTLECVAISFSLGRFIPKYFIPFDVRVNGLVSLTSLCYFVVSV